MQLERLALVLFQNITVTQITVFKTSSQLLIITFVSFFFLSLLFVCLLFLLALLFFFFLFFQPHLYLSLSLIYLLDADRFV